MTRREFVASSAAAAALAWVPSRCQALPAAPAGSPPAGLGPTLARLLALAARAPSSHNVQPWTVRLVGPRRLAVDLDPARRLPEVDPQGREMLVSLGCFLENLVQAAPAVGLHAEPEPSAGDGGHEVALAPGPTAGEGAERVRRRRTLRTGLRPEPLPADELRAVLALAGPGAAFFGRGSPEAARLAEAAVEAMRQQTWRDAAQRELSGWVRFSSAEVEQHRDGLTVDTMEASGMGAFVMRHFFDAESVMGKTFREKGIDLCARQAREGAGFLVLTAPDAGPVALVEAGRRFERVALSLRERSLAAHPMSQVLEEAPWRETLAQELRLDGTVQLVLRLGRVDRYPEPVSPRRGVAAFVRA